MPDFTKQQALDYFLELTRGNIPGQTAESVLGVNEAVSSTEQDLWDAGGSLVYPTAGETWEIVSADVNDTSAGTGARTVLIQSLDDGYVAQTEIVTMNGTTAVTLVATDSFRFRRALVLTAGSGAINAGALTIRVSGAGATRGMILAGNGNSLDGHFTVPAGKTAFLSFVSGNIDKGEDGKITIKSTIGTGGIFSVRLPLSLYQNTVVSPVLLPPPFSEKSDLNIRASSTNPATTISVALQFIMVDTA